MKMTRKEFLKSMAAASVAVAGTGTAASIVKACAPPVTSPKHNLALGVTIYSFGRDLLAGTRDLESCLAECADMGAGYVEILGETHVPGYPDPSDEWVDQWLGWLDKYNLKPSAYDIFCDTMFYKDRLLTPEELLEFLVTDMKLASRLGFHIFRQQVAPYPPDDPAESYLSPYVLSSDAMKFLELAIPYAEKYDIKMALELHGPTQIPSPWIEGCLELIERTKTKHLGFAPDFSAWTWRPPRGTVEELVEQGADREIIEYIISAYQQKLGPEKTVEEVKKMGGGETEQRFASHQGLFHSSNNSPEDIAIIAPYIYHTHAKFYDMQEDLTEYTIKYPEIIQAYIKNGVGGVLSSEYEGRNPDYSVSTAIRMQHAMLRNLLGMA